jgi:antitoxin ParD1/3/4
MLGVYDKPQEALMPTVTISLPESLKAFVERQVQTRGYGNVSEYFRTLLRDAQKGEDERRLEELLFEGLQSGEPIEVTPAYWEKKKAELTARAAARAAKR